jgi:hypothetical protein
VQLYPYQLTIMIYQAKLPRQLPPLAGHKLVLLDAQLSRIALHIKMVLLLIQQLLTYQVEIPLKYILLLVQK